MSDSLFSDNLERFSHMCPKAAFYLQDLDCSHLQFCKTSEGELNLCKREGDKEIYYHSPEGAFKEAHAWLDEIAPFGIKYIFVYGIGLGYYYDVLKEWLKRDPRRFLIFLEDDLAVIHRFLETEKAAEILRNPQVILQYFPTPGEREWGKFRQQFDWFFWAFSGARIAVHSLRLYQKERASMFKLIRNQINMNMVDMRLMKGSWIHWQEAIFHNFYSNLIWLGETGVAEKLYGKFPQIPSIICGAGPSITKQLPLLQSLEDRALIFGSGTGLNILNRNSIHPNFGAGLDPTPAQESRFMTNTAFELPIFYAHRFYAGAFSKVHGPRLYTTGNVPFYISEWFEKELGLTPTMHMKSGNSTSNFCVSIAETLGSNPIILIGMDMAYTGSSRYAQGVSAHPTDRREEHAALDKMAEDAFPAVGFDGNEVMTKWEWALEASFFTSFALTHPQSHLINATEGGLKVMEVTHLPFNEVIQKYLTQSYDLSNWIHAEIQQSHLPQVTEARVEEVIGKWMQSLERCQKSCEELLSEIKRSKPDAFEQSGPIALLKVEMEEEPAYTHFLKQLSWAFDKFSAAEINRLRFFPDLFSKEQKQRVHFEMEKTRYRFLNHYVELHLRLIRESLLKFHHNREIQQRLMEEAPPVPPPSHSSEDLYQFENDLLIIRDKELNISYEEPFAPKKISSEQKKGPHEGFIKPDPQQWDGQALLLYPDGAVEGETFYKQGKRHGPSSFYSADGQLLARSWFWNDLRVGKSWQYTFSGQLYSLLRYKDGLPHGQQEYYYPNGHLKTVMHYALGQLDGEINLYYPWGKLKRTLQFQQGKLHGTEKVWDEAGLLVIESEFKNGLPFGRSRAWHSNGRLAKEIVFYDNPQHFDLYLYDESGKIVQKKISMPENPMENIVQKSKDLRESIEKAAERLSAMQKKDEQ